MEKIIGRRARYTGSEQKLCDVIIIAAMITRGAKDPDEHLYLDNDKDIAAAGGVALTDRVEVRPSHPDGRASWITCDPLFADLRLLD